MPDHRREARLFVAEHGQVVSTVDRERTEPARSPITVQRSVIPGARSCTTPSRGSLLMIGSIVAQRAPQNDGADCR